MKIKVTIRESDFKRLQKFAYTRLYQDDNPPKTRYLRRIALWIALVVFFMFIFRTTSISLRDLHIPTLIVASIPLPLFLITFMYYFAQYQKKVIPRKDGITLGDKEFKMNDDGISEVTDLGNSFYKWNAIETVCDNMGDVYIFFDQAVAYIIPRSSFTSADERIAIIEFMKQQMKKQTECRTKPCT